MWLGSSQVVLLRRQADRRNLVAVHKFVVVHTLGCKSEVEEQAEEQGFA